MKETWKSGMEELYIPSLLSLLPIHGFVPFVIRAFRPSSSPLLKRGWAINYFLAGLVRVVKSAYEIRPKTPPPNLHSGERRSVDGVDVPWVTDVV